MDGSDGRVDIRLLEENHSFGAFIRQGLNASGSELALGERWPRPTTTKSPGPFF